MLAKRGGRLQAYGGTAPAPFATPAVATCSRGGFIGGWIPSRYQHLYLFCRYTTYHACHHFHARAATTLTPHARITRQLQHLLPLFHCCPCPALARVNIALPFSPALFYPRTRRAHYLSYFYLHCNARRYADWPITLFTRMRIATTLSAFFREQHIPMASTYHWLAMVQCSAVCAWDVGLRLLPPHHHHRAHLCVSPIPVCRLPTLPHTWAARDVVHASLGDKLTVDSAHGRTPTYAGAALLVSCLCPPPALDRRT